MKAGQRLKNKNPMKDVSMIISEINFRNKEINPYPYMGFLCMVDDDFVLKYNHNLATFPFSINININKNHFWSTLS